MINLLLAIIYLAFVGLGMSGSVLGPAWPSMYESLGAHLSQMGILTICISVGAIIANFVSYKLVKKLKMWRVTLLSSALIAASLFLYANATNFWFLCLASLPLGLASGVLDTSLNTYVALHYDARRISWLQAAWGLGSTVGPYILSATMLGARGWARGFAVIAWLQLALVVCVLASFPLWKKQLHRDRQTVKSQEKLSSFKALGLPGAKPILLAFFCFCAAETIAGQWASSYLVLQRGIDVAEAARWVSLFYLSITLGRIGIGFLPSVSDKMRIRLGQCVMLVGVVLMFLPLRALALPGLMLIGLGSSPIYPSLLHETPDTFGDRNSKRMMGVQMAVARLGSTLVPPLFGLMAERVTPALYPVFLLILTLVMMLAAELTHRVQVPREAPEVRPEDEG